MVRTPRAAPPCCTPRPHFPPGWGGGGATDVFLGVLKRERREFSPLPGRLIAWQKRCEYSMKKDAPVENLENSKNPEFQFPCIRVYYVPPPRSRTSGGAEYTECTATGRRRRGFSPEFLLCRAERKAVMCVSCAPVLLADVRKEIAPRNFVLHISLSLFIYSYFYLQIHPTVPVPVR